MNDIPMEPNEHRSQRARLIVGTIVTCLLTASMLTLVLRSTKPEPDHLMIESISHMIHRGRLEVSVTLRRPPEMKAELTSVRIWWLLGEFGDTRPWISPTYESRTIETTLKAGETTLQWSEFLPEEGKYQLSVWVHSGSVAPDKAVLYQHAASRFDTQPVVVPKHLVTRSSSPSGNVEITDIRTGNKPGFYEIEIRNLGDTELPILIDSGPMSDIERIQKITQTVAVNVDRGRSSYSVKVVTNDKTKRQWIRIRDGRSLVYLDQIVFDQRLVK